jgi:hypothetical protein
MASSPASPKTGSHATLFITRSNISAIQENAAAFSDQQSVIGHQRPAISRAEHTEDCASTG